LRRAGDRIHALGDTRLRIMRQYARSRIRLQESVPNAAVSSILIFIAALPARRDSSAVS
jgi:hypothetical protein